ncbi:MAG: hypothetical protein JWR15_1371 [Prosthecobacter sp.]|nr:hypothetical protein [Prosthecobacter sp.]
MSKQLYFRDHVLEGLSQQLYDRLYELVEYEGAPSFDPEELNGSWIWMFEHFGALNGIQTADSRVFRSQVSLFIASCFENWALVSKAFGNEKLLLEGIRELKQLIELSKSYPVLWWVYGDEEPPAGEETIPVFIANFVQGVPDDASIAVFLKLPHMNDLFREVSDKANEARFKNAEAAYNRQMKLEAKNRQRKQAKKT